MPWRGPEVPGEFPTLGYQVADWIEDMCAIPDGERAGDPYLLTDEQLRFLLHFYRVNEKTGRFHYERGGQLVRPQKWGKGPFSSAIVCAEAMGPVVFDGWDAQGEPVGREWATPWIQITAVSEAQTANVWRALVPMIRLGGELAAEIPDTGETRINLPGGGRIEPVTASAKSRLGQRITFGLQDEALALDTAIPTPNGWKTVFDIRPGDEVFGADGSRVKVLRRTPTQHNRQCYRLTFADNTSVVASDGHLWMTRVANSAAKKKIRTTGEMFLDGRRFRIPAPKPRDIQDRELPLDPYLLGLWLGDGSKGQTYITGADSDLAELRAILAVRNIKTGIRKGSNRCSQISLSNTNGYQGQNRPEIAKALRALPCFFNKHVPDEYKLGSIRQRTDLVAGLMDSDGHITDAGHCTFVGNDRLSADFLELIRGLGQVAQRIWRPDPRSRDGGYFKVNFCPRGDFVPFLLPRKAQRVRPQKGGADWVSVISIEPVDTVPVACIEVDSDDHLFLVGDAGHVTHNTHSWLETNGGRNLADNQRRNLSGMKGRWLETTNAWDPAEESVAQQTYEGETKGVYIDDVEPGEGSVRNKRDRRRMLKTVYGDSAAGDKERGIDGWIDLDRIDAEIVDLLTRDAPQAERFFLNRKRAGEARAFDPEKWDENAGHMELEAGSLIVLGIDGARFHDALAVIATHVETGYQWPVGIWETPIDAPEDYEHPFEDVDGAVSEAAERFEIWRAYIDPQYIEPLFEKWQGRYGERSFMPWYTSRPRQVGWAVREFTDAISAGDFQHDPDDTFTRHIKNAVKSKLNVRDDRQRFMWTISKDRVDSPRKIDAAMAAVLSWEARGDAISAGATTKQDKSWTTF